METTTIPGPRGLPIVGHLPWLLHDMLGFLQKLAREHGDIAAFRVGMGRAVLINSPELIDRVVKDRSFTRSAVSRHALSSFLGHGLLALEGGPHMRHRRLMQPAFHRERIKRYGALMAEETYRALSQFRSGETRDLRSDMMRLTFAIVSRSLFDTDTRADADAVEAALQRIQPAVMRYAQLSRITPFQLPARYGARTRAAIVGLRELVLKLIRRRRDGADEGVDLLSMLLSARDEDGSRLSDEEVCAELLTILFAGHETTANLMTWCWYLLTQHPALQESLAAEVSALVGDRELTFEDLPHLPLADRVVRETLRLYPPAWWADRVPSADVELGGHVIGANTAVAFSMYVTQRDPRFFPEPERFLPDRFLPERAAAIPEGAYLPFGAGVHVCIGNTFALMEARMILAAMAQRFHFQATPGHVARPMPLITLGMAEPFPITPIRRDPRLLTNARSLSH